MIAALAIVAAGAQAQIAFEDFDGGAFNLSSTTNVFDYGAGGGAAGDVFGRVSAFYLGGTGMPFDVADDTVSDVSGGGVFPDDTIALASQNTSAFFAMNDMDGSSAPLFPNATWTFDITSAIRLDDITIDLGALGDFEASSLDGFFIEYQIDGGGYTEIFRATTDEEAFKEYRPFDNGFIFADDDPLALSIDGGAPIGYLDKSDPVTGAFDSYTSLAIAGMTGSTLDIRVSWEGTPSGSEPMGIDNITINGIIPEPATGLLLAAMAIAALRRR
jgi:hypothetical protein